MEKPPDDDKLRGAACAELLPWVADKYLFADYHEDPFLFNTGMAICYNCPVKPACLEEAITGVAPDYGIRAGQSAGEITILHTEYLAGTPVEELVARTLSQKHRWNRLFRYQHPRPGEHSTRTIRHRA